MSQTPKAGTRAALARFPWPTKSPTNAMTSTLTERRRHNRVTAHLVLSLLSAMVFLATGCTSSVSDNSVTSETTVLSTVKDDVAAVKVRQLIESLVNIAPVSEKANMIATTTEAERSVVTDALATIRITYQDASSDRRAETSNGVQTSPNEFAVDVAILVDGQPVLAGSGVQVDAVRNADGEWQLTLESFCRLAAGLNVPCEDNTTAAVQTGACPVASIDAVGLDLVSTEATGFSSDGVHSRFVRGDSEIEVSLLSSASPGVLDSPALKIDSSTEIADRSATVFWTPDAEPVTVIVGWIESDVCGFYGIVTLGLDLNEAKELAATITLES